MKHSKFITVIVAVLMVPGLLFAAEKFAPSQAVAGADNTIIVPLEIANENGVMAIDIPLKFSEGVTLTDVTFEDTRVAEWDMKLFNINNEDRTVVIGLLHQMSPAPKPTLVAGRGPVANLVFAIDDPSVTEILIERGATDSPSHDLVLVYNTRSNPGQVAFDETTLEFEQLSVSLAAAIDLDLPSDFGLNQNYPNPFNPSTEIQFSLPSDSKVTLEIYNVLGQRVNILVDTEMEAGYHTVTWDGHNFNGGSVSSGVYFYRISASDFSATKKMMMLK